MKNKLLIIPILVFMTLFMMPYQVSAAETTCNYRNDSRKYGARVETGGKTEYREYGIGSASAAPDPREYSNNYYNGETIDLKIENGNISVLSFAGGSEPEYSLCRDSICASKLKSDECPTQLVLLYYYSVSISGKKNIDELFNSGNDQDASTYIFFNTPAEISSTSFFVNNKSKFAYYYDDNNEIQIGYGDYFSKIIKYQNANYSYFPIYLIYNKYDAQQEEEDAEQQRQEEIKKCKNFTVSADQKYCCDKYGATTFEYCNSSSDTSSGDTSSGDTSSGDTPSGDYNIDYDGNPCENNSVAGFVKVIGKFISIIQIVVPIILLILVIIDLVKMILSDEGSNSKTKKTMISRIIASVSIFLIIAIVRLIIQLVNKENINSCLDLLSNPW